VIFIHLSISLGFRRAVHTELQFLAIVSEVKFYSGIVTVKFILSKLAVIPTVVVYDSTNSGVLASCRKCWRVLAYKLQLQTLTPAFCEARKLNHVRVFHFLCFKTGI